MIIQAMKLKTGPSRVNRKKVSIDYNECYSKK